MSLFKTVILVKISQGVGEYVRGKWVEGEGVKTSFQGTWQPASGKQLELLPEGKRDGETYVCYAPIGIEFTTSDPVSGKGCDYVEINDRKFQVVRVSKWNNGVLPHNELLCVAVKEGEA